MDGHDDHTIRDDRGVGRGSAVTCTAVLQLAGVHWASSKVVAERALSRRPGVIEAAANPVAQTATVTYDPQVTTVAHLADWLRDCGYHCAGQSVPQHVCDPMAEPGVHHDAHTGHDTHAAHGETPTDQGMTAQEAMGHGGHHAGMSMADMARDMRNRFLVALILSVPILLWSPIGREVLSFEVAAPEQ